MELVGGNESGMGDWWVRAAAPYGPRGNGYPSQRVDVSKEGFDPLLIPPPEGMIPGEDYWRVQGEMRKTADEIFARLRK